MSEYLFALSGIVSPRRWRLRFAVASGVLAAAVVVAWLAVPPIVRSQLESQLAGALGRKTTIEAVEFNPFSLRLTVRKLAVADPGRAPPLFAIDEVDANFSLASLWHRAPVLEALKLVHPAVSLARDREGRYSVQDLIDRMLGQPDQPLPKFSLNNIEIDGGSAAFDDGVTGARHRLDDVSIGIPFLSSLPYQADIRVTPHLEGMFDGSRFALGGTTTPFAQRREATIDIDVDALPLKAYVGYLPTRPRFALNAGTLTTRLKVVFVEGELEERRLEVRGDARIDGLAVARRDGSSLFAADRIAFMLERIDLFGRDARVAEVTIDAPALDLRRLRDGSVELAQPFFEAAEGAARGEGPEAAIARVPERPWSLTVAKTAIARGRLTLADETADFRSSLADVTLDASNLSTKVGEKAHVALSFVSADRIAAFRGEADVEPLIPAASGRFELTKFSLGLLAPYYRDVLAVDVQKGSLDLAAHFALLPDGTLRLSEGAGAIDGLALAYPGSRQPFWAFPNVAAGGIEIDVRERSVRIAELRSRNATMRIARERDGSLDVARLMKTTAATGTAADDRTWTLALGKLQIEKASIDLEDRVPKPAVKLPIRDLAVAAANFTNARGAKTTASLRARVGGRAVGRVAWSGVLVSNPLAVSGQLDVSGLDLVPVRPYVESRANVSLVAGTLAAKGALALDIAGDGPVRATWRGNVVVTDFAALDRPTASDLLRWKRLAFDDADVASEPFRFAVRRIGAEDYYARAIVYPDGTLNLTRLLTPGLEAEPSAEAKPAVKPAAAPRLAREALPVTIGRIELARGNVNLTDYFVRPNYAANLTDVTGSVTTMSSEQAGDIAVVARVDHSAPVEVSGRIHPFAKDLSLDIRAKARDIDLPPLTPYAVRYAGYGIEKGKLAFEVHYRVESRNLAAENRLVLDQLTFNPERVDSPTATKLPVLLAVALLKDTRGVIDIELPIAGSLDDPEFSVGGLIVRVIVNLLAKAVTAPFALLAAAFGHGEELSVVPFPPGGTVPDADGQSRIDTLAKALADRPALKLDIGGRADPEIDRTALARAAVESAMRREKMKALAAVGTAPASVEQVAIDAGERVRWLAAAYRESSIKERPRNAGGILQDLPPAEMESMLLANAKVDDDALRRLANARAQAVKDALTGKGITGERLFLTVPELGRAREGHVSGPPASRVDLALR